MSSTSGDVRRALGTCRRALEIARDRGAARVEVVDVQGNEKNRCMYQLDFQYS